MHRFIRVIILDFKEMSVTKYVPIVLTVVLTIYSVMVCSEAIPEKYNIIVAEVLNMCQSLIPPAVSWWVIMVFHSYVEDDGAEVFFSFSYSRKKMGIGRTSVLCALFTTILIINCSSLTLSGILTVKDMPLFLLVLLAQSLYYAGISFVMILLTRNILWTFAIVMFILIINIWKGISMITSYISVVVDMSRGIRFDYIWPKMVYVTVVTILFFIIGQKLFDRYKFK